MLPVDPRMTMRFTVRSLAFCRPIAMIGMLDTLGIVGQFSIFLENC